MFESVQGSEHFRGAMPEGEGFFSRPHWLFDTPLIFFCNQLVGLHGLSETRASRGPLELDSCVLLSKGSLCHLSHQWRLTKETFFKRLLNAVQSLHRDLMSSSSPRCRNRCMEASIEPFLPIDDLLPFLLCSHGNNSAIKTCFFSQ